MSVVDNKRQILDATIRIMAEKGQGATVSEIASAAELNESMIYHYFRDKEDLMFYAVGDQIRNVNDTFFGQIQGIRDPASRLSKLVYEQLHCLHDNPNYTRYLLFFCRSKKSFFLHEAFEQIVRWARMLSKILEDGIQDGTFAKNLSVPVARDMILGFLDMENIDFLTVRRPEPSEKDFDEVMSLFMLLLKEDTDRPPKKENKRETILTTAESIFAEKDYHKATTIEIAKKSHVSEATLYEYFQSKEDILFSALQYRLQNYLILAEDLFEIKSPMSKLLRFIFYPFTISLRRPNFVKNFIMNGIYNQNFYRSSAYEELQRYLAVLDRILDEGKADGSFRPGLNNRHFENLFLGIFNHTALLWLLTDENKRFATLGRINDIASLLLKIVLNPDRERRAAVPRI